MLRHLPSAILQGVFCAVVTTAFQYWWDAKVPSVGGLVVGVIVFTAVFLVAEALLKRNRAIGEGSLREIVIKAITKSK